MKLIIVYQFIFYTVVLHYMVHNYFNAFWTSWDSIALHFFTFHLDVFKCYPIIYFSMYYFSTNLVFWTWVTYFCCQLITLIERLTIKLLNKILILCHITKQYLIFLILYIIFNYTININYNYISWYVNVLYHLSFLKLNVKRINGK